MIRRVIIYGMKIFPKMIKTNNIYLVMKYNAVNFAVKIFTDNM